jgi:hypothetical protein
MSVWVHNHMLPSTSGCLKLKFQYRKARGKAGERVSNKGKLSEVFSFGNGHTDTDRYATSLSARATP